MSSVEDTTAFEASAADDTLPPNPKTSGKGGIVGWYTNLTIKTKILLPIVVASAVALVIGLLSLWAGAQASQRADSLYRENVQGVSALSDMREAIADMRVAARDDALAVHDADKDAADQQLDDAYAAFDAAAQRYTSTQPDKARSGELRALSAAVSNYLDAIETVLNPLADSGELTSWWVQNESKVQPLADSMLD